MLILNDGLELDTDDCAIETGRTYHDEGDEQVADQPSAANVLITEATWGTLENEHRLMRVLDDPEFDGEVGWTKGDAVFAYCIYTDKFTGRRGIEYGDTPSAAIAAALNVIVTTRRMREGKAA
jgi:hypothetical protein